MKSYYFLIMSIVLMLASSCDKYEKEKPAPVELSFSKPGIVEFRIRQMSKGKAPDLNIDTMEMIIINQSISNLENIKYAIRGFRENRKEYSTFSYWQEQRFVKPIPPYNEDNVQQLSKSFDDIISYDNFEVDLLSCNVGNNLVSHKHSGSYRGNYTVFKDSVYQTFGAHYSWIDYSGKIITYFDRGDFPYISFSGQIVNDTIVYGYVLLNDKNVSVSSPLTDSIGQIYLNFGFNENSVGQIILNLTLVKN